MLIQREYDGKWEKIEQFPDYDNSYRYVDENGIVAWYVPTKWVTVAVYDFLMEVK